MCKEHRDGVEYHLRFKGELDPRVGLLVRIWCNLILSQVIGDILGVGSRMKRLGAWSLVLYLSVA